MPNAGQQINTRLSHWAATTHCPCGLWQFQRSSARSPEQVCWERYDTETGLWVRTWYAIGAGAERTWEYVGPDACEVCGWDLTRDPLTNIKSMADEEWAGTIVGANLSIEGQELADILPDSVEIAFDSCTLDNVVLHGRHTMVSSSQSSRGSLCSHNRIHNDAEGMPALHNWQTGERIMGLSEAAEARAEARRLRNGGDA